MLVLSEISVHESTPRQYLDFELTSYKYCPSQPAFKGTYIGPASLPVEGTLTFCCRGIGLFV